jgi:hypothetical protein
MIYNFFGIRCATPGATHAAITLSRIFTRLYARDIRDLGLKRGHVDLFRPVAERSQGWVLSTAYD